MHIIKPCRRDKKVHSSKWFNHSSTTPAQSVFLPACIRVLNMPDPTGIVCFSPRNTQNTIPLEDKRLFLHPRRVPSPHRFLTQEAERKVAARDAALRLHLMLRREGGKQGKEGEEKKNEKDYFFFPFFPPPTCDKSCSHMGGTSRSYLTQCWLWWSQWSIQPGCVTLSRPARRRHAGAVPQSVGL